MKKPSALLVDDDGHARTLLASILRELGCTSVIAAASGEEAIAKLKGKRIDILFLDIEMPDMNGFSTLEKVLEHSPKQYVIMISAHSTLDNVKKAIELGARGFIVKPYTGAKVRDLLEKHTKDQAIPAADAETAKNDEVAVESPRDAKDSQSEPGNS